MAKIDVALPYWGDPELFKKTVDSVMAQSEFDWRLLVFDDGYPSNEAEEYCKKLNDNRIIYNRNPENLGITKNFNHALKSVGAEYCVIMGCDDIMLPNYIETALKNIGQADFYQPNVDVINSTDKTYLPMVDLIKKLLRPKKAGIYGGERLAASLSHGNWLYFPSIMWRSKTIKQYGFNDKYKIAEDVVLEFSIIKNGGKLHVDNATTFLYRRFADSLSSREKSKGGIRFGEEDEVYEHFANEFKKIGWNKAARAAKLRITSRLHRLLS